MVLSKRIAFIFFAALISVGCISLHGCSTKDTQSTSNSNSSTSSQATPYTPTDFSLLIYTEAKPCKKESLAGYRQTEANLNSGTHRWSRDEEGNWKEIASNWVMPLTIDTEAEVSEVYYISNQENVSFGLYEYQDQTLEVSA